MDQRVRSGLRDAATAKRLFRKVLTNPSHPQPRVINTGQARLYGPAISATPLPPPAYPILDQHPGAGSSSDQTTSEGQAGTDSVHQQAVRGGCMRRRPDDPTNRWPFLESCNTHSYVVWRHSRCPLRPLSHWFQSQIQRHPSARRLILRNLAVVCGAVARINPGASPAVFPTPRSRHHSAGIMHQRLNRALVALSILGSGFHGRKWGGAIPGLFGNRSATMRLGPGGRLDAPFICETQGLRPAS